MRSWKLESGLSENFLVEAEDVERGRTASQQHKEAMQEMQAAWEGRLQIHKTLQLNQFPVGKSILDLC